MKRLLRMALRAMLIAVLVVYLAAYVSLSRRGRTQAIQYNSDGFYYFTPENSDAWRFRERTCTILFWPLSQLDSWLNPEMGHNPEPMMDLS